MITDMSRRCGMSSLIFDPVRRGVELMASSWVLDCPECKQVYVYAKVPTERFSDAGNNPFVWPLKPFPLEGLSFECPNCKKTSIYTRSDLRYRSY